MSRKTKRLHKRHHRHNKKNIKTRKHRRRYTHKKRKQIVIIPGNKGIPLFTKPDNKKSQKIIVNQHNNQGGNMIMGLRNM